MYVQNESNPYVKAFNQDVSKAYNEIKKEKTSEDPTERRLETKLHLEAVNVSVSTNNIMNYLNITNTEFSKSNTTAQELLQSILNGKNSQYMDFFAGKTMENGFSLEGIGYEGKPLSELSTDEAKELVSDEGFFGINETSDRVSNFVLSLAGNNIDALKESRKGLVQGFEEALKLFGGELPEISHKTQERTLSIIDKKIEELTKTNLEKEVEAKGKGVIK